MSPNTACKPYHWVPPRGRLIQKASDLKAHSAGMTHANIAAHVAPSNPAKSTTVGVNSPNGVTIEEGVTAWPVKTA